MVLIIKLGVKKENKLRKQLIKQTPSIRDNIKMKTSKGKRIKFKRNINSQVRRIKKSVPDFEKQAVEMTEL